MVFDEYLWVVTLLSPENIISSLQNIQNIQNINTRKKYSFMPAYFHNKINAEQIIGQNIKKHFVFEMHEGV